MSKVEVGRVPSAPGSSSLRSPEPATPSRPLRGDDPSRDVLQVFADLESEFGGSWMSNGVACILVHHALPEQFGKEEWADWTFCPAVSAFEWAHNRGLIVPWKLSGKWVFTDFGRKVAAHARALAGEDSQ